MFFTEPLALCSLHVYGAGLTTVKQNRYYEVFVQTDVLGVLNSFQPSLCHDPGVNICQGASIFREIAPKYFKLLTSSNHIPFMMIFVLPVTIALLVSMMVFIPCVFELFVNLLVRLAVSC